MKNVFKKAALFSCVAIFGFGITNAQEVDSKETRKKSLTEFTASLTAEQKVQMANQKTMQKKQREALKATYTKDQLEIAESKNMKGREKSKALRATYSDSQKEMIKAHRTELKKEKETFRATLTEAQKETLPRRAKAKGKMERKHDGKKRDRNLREEKSKRSKKMSVAIINSAYNIEK